jgi:hypothetical protein
MPVLKNARHERFAQLIAAGETTLKAFEKAGYKSDAPNATRMRNVDKVAKRIDELLTTSANKVTDQIAFNREWIMDKLRGIVERALPVQAQPSDKPEFAAANRALELLGKELGMFVDRKEVRTGSLLDEVEPSELEQLRALLASGSTSDDEPKLSEIN